MEAPLIKLKGCIVIKFLRDYKKSGFSLHRLRRMNRQLNRSPEGFLECIECGTIYKYPRVEVCIGLVGPIPPFSFCSRRCFDKFLNRVQCTCAPLDNAKSAWFCGKGAEWFDAAQAQSGTSRTPARYL